VDTFLQNYVSQLASVDFFTVHTIWFEILFVFIVLAHDRRGIVHFNVTAQPTAEWTAQQILEAFPFDTAPRYLLRDRDRVYGQEFRNQVAAMNIKEVLSAPRSPWQRAYVERVIGSIRRECLDHVMVFSEESLRRTLHSYFYYYHRSRLHLSLERDSPESRPVQSIAGSLLSRKSAACTIVTHASHNIITSLSDLGSSNLGVPYPLIGTDVLAASRSFQWRRQSLDVIVFGVMSPKSGADDILRKDRRNDSTLSRIGEQPKGSIKVRFTAAVRSGHDVQVLENDDAGKGSVIRNGDCGEHRSILLRISLN
jgi:hypothetical protein